MARISSFEMEFLLISIALDFSKYIPAGTLRLIRQDETEKRVIAVIIIIFALFTNSNIRKNNNIVEKNFVTKVKVVKRIEK